MYTNGPCNYIGPTKGCRMSTGMDHMSISPSIWIGGSPIQYLCVKVGNPTIRLGDVDSSYRIQYMSYQLLNILRSDGPSTVNQLRYYG